ncbi:Four and a half LIM domains protein 2 [Amphibalanus amphitrite]|uniref:Four and a half LIM domains protein 2 n=1 Tax=Amphibalanus amphitrite TaxID=1232801 RepID=A0A6A4VLV1_AMPAM|nr:Four and a half LIM domains protein 2 [Amphibalanus amphitrite]
MVGKRQALKNKAVEATAKLAANLSHSSPSSNSTGEKTAAAPSTKNKIKKRIRWRSAEQPRPVIVLARRADSCVLHQPPAGFAEVGTVRRASSPSPKRSNCDSESSGASGPASPAVGGPRSPNSLEVPPQQKLRPLTLPPRPVTEQHARQQSASPRPSPCVLEECTELTPAFPKAVTLTPRPVSEPVPEEEAPVMPAHQLRHRRRCAACRSSEPAAAQWRAVRAELAAALESARGVRPVCSAQDILITAPCDVSSDLPPSGRPRAQPVDGRTVAGDALCDFNPAEGPFQSESALRAGYSWLPAGLPSGAAGEFMRQLPEQLRPLLHSPGQRERTRRLLRQLPAHDLSLACCRHVSAEQRGAFAEWAAARRRLALEAGMVTRLMGTKVCRGCRKTITAGALAVTARRFPISAWHPACFRCADCAEPLADLVFCELFGEPLCLRHHGERLRPRCAACDELIFSGEFVCALGLAWHREHLACDRCAVPLDSRRFALRLGAPLCLECYRAAGAPVCLGCDQSIELDSRQLSYGGRHWHSDCFTCRACGTPLEGQQFALHDGRALCAPCCGESAVAPACSACSAAIAADTPQVVYKAFHWHQACFICCVCQTPLDARTFLPKEQRLFCPRCYEDTFAARCRGCGGTITSLGVTYQGETFHRRCFVCAGCETPLAGQKFRSRAQRCYCADCYTKLFSKRCASCQELIPREPGTKYSVFRDRCWHNACFVCTVCKQSLVGRGFIDADGELLCATAECAASQLAAKADN